MPARAGGRELGIVCPAQHLDMGQGLGPGGQFRLLGGFLFAAGGYAGLGATFMTDTRGAALAATLPSARTRRLILRTRRRVSV